MRVQVVWGVRLTCRVEDLGFGVQGLGIEFWNREKGVQESMVSRVEMIKWIQTKRLSIKNTLLEKARLTSAALIPVDAEPFPRT